MNTEQLKQIFDENADVFELNGHYIPAMTESTFIEVVSELMNEVEMKLKEPNFYIVNSKKYLTDEQRISVAEKITQMSTTPTWIEIKCEDDLPKDDGIYLIDCEHGVTMAEFSRYGNGNTSWWAVTAIGTYEDSEGAKKVTAWMPLPTHPQTTTTK